MENENKLIKLNWKYKIFSGLVLGVIYLGVLLIFNNSSDGEVYSLNSMIFQAVFFGFFMGIGFPYASDKFASGFVFAIGKNIKPTLTENELVDIEAPANLFRGMEGVGGKLFLTNKRIIFNSHKFNIQKGQTEIDYENISDVIKRKTGKLVDNGIRIKTKNGQEFDFVVTNRDQLIEKLNEKIKM